MRVVATKTYQSSDVEFFRAELPDVEFWFPQDSEDLKNLKDFVSGVDVFLGPPPCPNIIAEVLDTLKLVQIPWSGVDEMDFTSCREHSVVCANSHTNATSVAELAVSLCLDVLKATPFHDAEFRYNRRHRPGSPEGFFPPRLLTGQSVGILGYGAIGREIHRMLAGFNVDICALSYSRRKAANICIYDRETEFSDFLERSEILFLAAPLTTKTKNILNLESLSYMRQASVLVNISRAELIDIRALHDALVNQKIAGVALDVHWRHLSAENAALADEIYKMQNVVLSPHRGGFVAGELPHLRGAIANIRKVAEGRMEEIVGRIDFDREY